MDTTSWASIQREDGETVGYLDPVDADFERVVPRNVLGHAVADPTDYLSGEEFLIQRGISELMNDWIITSGDHANSSKMSILEVSSKGIILADALMAKALAPTPRLKIQWPDTTHILKPAGL